VTVFDGLPTSLPIRVLVAVHMFHNHRRTRLQKRKTEESWRFFYEDAKPEILNEPYHRLSFMDFTVRVFGARCFLRLAGAPRRGAMKEVPNSQEMGK